MKVSKSFVIEADAVKAYDVARDFFLTLGYSEQSAIRPTLLVLKRRGDIQTESSPKNEDYRINLRVSFNPVGDLQLYSAALLTIRCDYDAKVSGGVAASSDKATLEGEAKRLRNHIMSKGLDKSTVTSSATRSATPSPRAEKAVDGEGSKHTGRITTGYEDLDNLLFGGIPEKYAVVMTSPSIDERDLLIRRFLESGAKAGQITFYITVEPGNGSALAKESQSNFYLFVCNPRADVMMPSLPNVFKLKGVESLTDIDIALTKSFRMLDSSRPGPRRACIEIISDVLLQHHAVITRKWLSGLLPDLKAKGFTTLAVVNPHMHPQEEVQAVLGLFDGEIRIYEKETEKGVEKILRIRKLCNQRYLENELTLTREKLES